MATVIRTGARFRAGPAGGSPVTAAPRRRASSGSAPNSVWAVGFGGAIVHWDGTAWSPVPSGSGQGLLAVWGSGAHDVWAAGNAGTLLRH